MKGPHERLKYTVRRVWECRECRHREWTDGATTVVYCSCQQKKPFLGRVVMRLVEDGIRRVEQRA